MPGTLGSQKRVLDVSELELQTVGFVCFVLFEIRSLTM